MNDIYNIFARPLKLLNRSSCHIVATLLCMSVVCNAADPIHSLEDFSSGGVANWTNEETSQVLLSNSGGKLNAAYILQRAPAFVEDVVKVPIVSGSYITNISFKLDALDYKPSKLRLQFHARESDAVWSLDLVPPEAGSQIVVNQPLIFSSGWSIGADSPQVQFDTDLWSIDWVGVYIRRNADIELQNYSIDDFMIKGLFYIVDNDLDGIADSWEVAHGLNTNKFNDAELDPDQDGMSNYAEFRAGTDPKLASSSFKLKLEEDSIGTGQPFELRWNSIANRWYTVRRSTNLLDGFSLLETGVESRPPINVYQDLTATNAPAYFYKIEVEPEL